MALSFATLETNTRSNSETPWLSYGLRTEFVDTYADVRPDWGFPLANGDSFSELVFVMKYSRLKADGTKERWFETVARFVNGTFSILLDHLDKNNIWYNFDKLDALAEEMFERAFAFKWLPPGRGIANCGTYHVHAMNHASTLQNCALVGTEHIAIHSHNIFTTMTEMLMSGIGVGYDTEGAGLATIIEPQGHELHVVADSKEGWAEAIANLVSSYIDPGKPNYEFDFSLVRPKGSPISSGGIAPGPEPLKTGLMNMRRLLDAKVGQAIDSRLINDLGNNVGVLVVSGGKRRSAMICFSNSRDEDFRNLKNWELPENKERTGPGGWSFLSNNTVELDGTESDELIQAIADSNSVNGEPGVIWGGRDKFLGRTGHPEDVNRADNARFGNPCLEQLLETRLIELEDGSTVVGGENCTLAEVTLPRHDSQADLEKSIRAAFLYAKIITLMPTEWAGTNAIIAANRRVGVGLTGMAEAIETGKVFDLDAAYRHLRTKDIKWSDWLGIVESVRRTTVKPSGTVSLVAGTTAGVHWPVTSGNFVRTVRLANHDPLCEILEKAGFDIEPDQMAPTTTNVVSFPVSGHKIRNEREVPLREKLALASHLQDHWSDNSVSVTATFLPSEADQLPAIIRNEGGKVHSLKNISFLPLEEGGNVYKQAPIQDVTSEVFAEMASRLSKIDWSAVYSDSDEGETEAGCTNDSCQLV